MLYNGLKGKTMPSLFHTYKEYSTKKSKFLMMVLIGLLMIAGLVLASCGNNTCKCYDNPDNEKDACENPDSCSLIIDGSRSRGCNCSKL